MDISKFLTSAKTKIKNKDYKGALGELEPIIMFAGKNVEVYVLAGFCQKELYNYHKQEEYLTIANEIRPNDLNILKGLYQAHQQTDKFKNCSIIPKLCQILKSQLDKPEKIKNYFDYQINYIVLHCELHEKQKIEECYINLLEEPLVSIEILYQASELIFDYYINLEKNINPIVFEKFQKIFGYQKDFIKTDNILEKILSFHEKSFTMNPKNLKNNLEFIYDGFPFSFVIVEYFFKNISLFLNEFPSVFYYKLLKDSLFCLFTNECKPGENERNYQDLKKNSSSLIENIDFYARNFLTFSKLFLEKYLKFESDKLHELFNLFESKYMQKFLDVSKLMDNSFILIIPIKIFVRIRNKEFEEVEGLIKIFKDRIHEISNFTSTLKFEEICGEFLIQTSTDLNLLIDNKEKLKIRLKNNEISTKTLKIYYELQMKITRSTYIFDEELNLKKFLKTILEEEHENCVFLAEENWFNFSDLQTLDLNEIRSIVQKFEKSFDFLKKSTNADPKILSQFQKRLGTLYWINNSNDGNGNPIDISKIWLEAYSTASNDYQINVCLGLYYWESGKCNEALKFLKSAFILNHYDINLNKMLFYTLSKVSRFEAFDFALRIYPNFKNVFFLNYSLSLYFLNEKRFEEAETFILKSMEIFQNLKANKFSQNRTEKKLILHGKTSTIPYLINQNEIFYLEDYPIFNDEMYAQDATILSNVFFNKNNILLNEFKLWLQLAQINKNIGKIAACEKCLSECFTLIKDENFNLFSKENPFRIYFFETPTFIEVNSKEISELCNIFEETFINKRNLINEDFMKFDIETYFYESLLINLDFALYSYYKRDFNAAFAHLFSCFKILLIISEKKFNLLIEKIHNAFVDLFSYLIEICSGYITYIYNNQGINQAQFFVIKLGNLLEKFLNWKVVVENKLLDGNFCFLKSLIDFYINSSIISLKPESSYKSIEICLEVLEKISKVKQQTILEEIDNKTMKLENSTVFKNILLIKNEYLNVTLNNFLQSLSICYVLAHNYTNEEKSKFRGIGFAKLGILLYSSEIKFWNLLALTEDEPRSRLNILLKSLQIDKRNTFSINSLGLLFLKNEKYEAALKFFLKALEINPKNIFSFLSLVCICLIYFIENTSDFNKIDLIKDNFENINDLQYFKDFFLSKARSYTTFSLISKFSKPVFLLDLIIQVFFKYDSSFQFASGCSLSNMQGLNISESHKEIFNVILIINQLNEHKICDREESFDNLISDKKNIDLIKFLQSKLNSNKEILIEFIISLKSNLENELKLHLQNLSDFLSEKKKKTPSQEIVILFTKFMLKLQIFLHLTNLSESCLSYLEFVDNILVSLSSLPEIQKLHGNLLNLMDIRSNYKSLLISYYHFLVQIKYNLSDNLKDVGQLNTKINDKVKECFYVITNYHADKKKLTEDDLIWPFEFINQKEFTWKKENAEFVFYSALEKLNKKQNFEAKTLLQKSILLNPSERKYRETYLAFYTLIEKEFFKNDKLLQLKEETNLSYLIKVTRESLMVNNKIKCFSKLMIYCPTIDIFYSFCRCLFELSQNYDAGFYNQITNYMKIYLKNNNQNEYSQRFINKLIKLYLELIIHFQMAIKNNKLVNLENEKEGLEILLKEDIGFITNHSGYNQNISNYHEIINAFYNFDQNDFPLEKALKVFSNISNINQKLSFILGILRKMFIKAENKEIFQEIQELKKLIMSEVEKIEKEVSSSKIKSTIIKFTNAISILEVYIYIISLNELHKSESEFSKLELLTQLKESAELILSSSSRKVNLILIYIHYCNLTQKLEEMNDKLVLIESLLHSKNENLYWTFFCLLFHFHSVSKNPYDEESVNGFNQFYDFIFENFSLNSTFISLLLFMKGMILLQTNFDPHRKKESLTKLFKLACLYQPEKSLVFVSYISNYEPKYENMEEIKEEEKCELEGPKEREEIEEDYQ